MAALFKYVGTDDPTDNRTCEVFGLTFPFGEAVEVEDARAISKLSENGTFEKVEPSRKRSAAE